MCGCKSKIGSMKKSVGGYKLERLAAVGGGAILSKVITNPLLKAIGMDGTQEGIKAYTGPAIKLVGGYFALQQKNQMVKDAGLGMIATGILEAVEIWQPKIFAPLAGGGATPQLLTRVNGIGAPVQVLDMSASLDRMAGYEDTARMAGLENYM